MVEILEIKVEKSFSPKNHYHIQYHLNSKTNIEQRRIIKESLESTRSLANRFLVSHVTVAKWRKAEHLEDKSSRPKTIYYALSKAEC